MSSVRVGSLGNPSARAQAAAASGTLSSQRAVPLPANGLILIDQVIRDVQAEGLAYMQPRIRAETTGPGMVRAYIESNLAFIRDHRNHMAAILDIARNAVTADGQRRFHRDGEATRAERLLTELLAKFQAAGELRADFDPKVMAVTIGAAITAIPPRLVADPNLDVDSYAAEIATTFDLATRLVQAHHD